MSKETKREMGSIIQLPNCPFWSCAHYVNGNCPTFFIIPDSIMVGDNPHTSLLPYQIGDTIYERAEIVDGKQVKYHHPELDKEPIEPKKHKAIKKKETSNSNEAQLRYNRYQSENIYWQHPEENLVAKWAFKEQCYFVKLKGGVEFRTNHDSNMVAKATANDEQLTQQQFDKY